MLSSSGSRWLSACDAARRTEQAATSGASSSMLETALAGQRKKPCLTSHEHFSTLARIRMLQSGNVFPPIPKLNLLRTGNRAIDKAWGLASTDAVPKWLLLALGRGRLTSNSLIFLAPLVQTHAHNTTATQPVSRRILVANFTQSPDMRRMAETSRRANVVVDPMTQYVPAWKKRKKRKKTTTEGPISSP